jgi:hypothetical protein
MFPHQISLVRESLSRKDGIVFDSLPRRDQTRDVEVKRNLHHGANEPDRDLPVFDLVRDIQVQTQCHLTVSSISTYLLTYTPAEGILSAWPKDTPYSQRVCRTAPGVVIIGKNPSLYIKGILLEPLMMSPGKF